MVKYIIIILIFFVAYSPLYLAVYATPKPYPFSPSSRDDGPICVRDCYDMWEAEGNFGKPW